MEKKLRSGMTAVVSAIALLVGMVAPAQAASVSVPSSLGLCVLDLRVNTPTLITAHRGSCQGAQVRLERITSMGQTQVFRSSIGTLVSASGSNGYHVRNDIRANTTWIRVL